MVPDIPSFLLHLLLLKGCVRLGSVCASDPTRIRYMSVSTTNCLHQDYCNTLTSKRLVKLADSLSVANTTA